MSSFKDLPLLKQWIYSNKYSIKSSEKSELKKTGTHYLLDGGIWKVPMEKYPEFLRLLSNDLQNGEKYYISENRSKVFRFISDLDFLDDEAYTITQVERVVKKIQEIMVEYYPENICDVLIYGNDNKTVLVDSEEYIKSGFHLIWPKIWITAPRAMELRLKFIEHLTESFGERSTANSWGDVVDLAVYTDNGLRMVGCRKMAQCKQCIGEECKKCSGCGKIDEGRVYSIKSILPNNEEQLKILKKDFRVSLMESSIMNYQNFEESKMIKKLPIPVQKEKGSTGKSLSSNDDFTVKIENFIKKHFKATHGNIRIKKITKVDDTKYFVDPNSQFCQNVNRSHNSSGIYFQIKPSGVSQRCFCKKDTLDGRSSGPCKEYSSSEVPLSKILQNLLFPEIKLLKGSKRKIINCSLTSSLSSDKIQCLNNCKNILFQLENELI